MWRRLSLLDRFPLIHRSAVQVLVLSFLPESPRWLLALHTPAECLESMRTLRRTNDVSLFPTLSLKHVGFFTHVSPFCR
jgi:hypothetical protein